MSFRSRIDKLERSQKSQRKNNFVIFYFPPVNTTYPNGEADYIEVNDTMYSRLPDEDYQAFYQRALNDYSSGFTGEVITLTAYNDPENEKKEADEQLYSDALEMGYSRAEVDQMSSREIVDKIIMPSMFS